MRAFVCAFPRASANPSIHAMCVGGGKRFSLVTVNPDDALDFQCVFPWRIPYPKILSRVASFTPVSNPFDCALHCDNFVYD